MALDTSVVQEGLNDIGALLPEVAGVIASGGMNIAQDIVTVEHVATALVSLAGKFNVPHMNTIDHWLPLAHQLFGVFGSWFQAKNASVAPAPVT